MRDTFHPRLRSHAPSRSPKSRAQPRSLRCPFRRLCALSGQKSLGLSWRKRSLSNQEQKSKSKMEPVSNWITVDKAGSNLFADKVSPPPSLHHSITPLPHHSTTPSPHFPC